ncbi:MAG: DNA polymerase III subunit gamma/tau [Lachnospiraceae bacterium]|nr:DNA polymerase III subunit gamma/tau [Lachnospiraceae bacterium]
MSYTALYRKWRPDRFEDVKGQDAIVQTLKNQIETGRIGHAYLFCGTRGTGKTSVAKLFAKVVNCESPVNGDPCGKCASCMAIKDGSSMNVIEIDAASNNGVDNVRDIREDVVYSPAVGKYKVYIIDEVHMLTPGAFNALLKTLEEPPSYVIFILATTEVHKIPVTILSRCQRYDFKRISVETIVDRLKELMEGEGIKAEEKALRYIARSADGALRDAISLFDQCNAFYYGQELTYENTLSVLGAVDTEVFSRLLRCILKSDIRGFIELLDEITLNGRDLSQFVSDFTWYLRNLLLIKTAASDNIEDILDVSKENLERIREEAGVLKQEGIMRYIRIFSELSGSIKYSPQKRILLEIALIKLCRPAMETDYSSVTERVRFLEKETDELKDIINKLKEDPSQISQITVEKKEKEPETVKIPLPEEIEKEVIEASKRRNEILNNIDGITKELLLGATWSAESKDKLVIIPKSMEVDITLDTETTRNLINTAMDKVLGFKVDFEIKLKNRNTEKKEEYTELNTIEGIDMEIETEE